MTGADSTLMASSVDLLGAGATVEGKYQIVKPLGEGAMGSVFMARDMTLDRLVAIKVLKGEVAGRIEEDARFRQEARVLSRLSHPNIVTVYAYGAVPGGANYIAMEYVHGRTLAEMVSAGDRLPVDAMCHVVTQVGYALSAAHERGMVHRDVKPGNVLITSVAGDDHFVKVVDFGLAKILVDGLEEGAEEFALKTAEGMAMGTPAYLSPEQARGDGKIDERSDVYAFGVLACQLLTGELPFDSANAQQFLLAHVAHDPRLPSALMPGKGIPEGGELDRVIARALEKQPDDRYQDVLEFADDFVRAVQVEVIVPQKVSVVPAQDTLDWSLDQESMPLVTAQVAAHSELRVAILCVELDRLLEPGATILLQERMEVLAIFSAKLRRIIEADGGILLPGTQASHVAVYHSSRDDLPATEEAVIGGLTIRAALDAVVSDPTVPDGIVPRYRIGVDVGRLYMGCFQDVGEVAFGPALVGAREMARHADAGELRLSEDGYRQVRGLFKLDYTRPGTPGRSIVRSRERLQMSDHEIQGVPVRLQGREQEVQTLAAELRAVQDGHGPRALLVHGAAGHGKTRLIQRFLELVEDSEKVFRLEAGRCTSWADRLPFHPFAQALRRRLGIEVGDDLEDVKEKAEYYYRRRLAEDPTTLTAEAVDHIRTMVELASGTGPQKLAVDMIRGDTARRAVFFERIAKLFARLSSEHTTMIYLDDFQWSSLPTRKLLSFLARSLTESPLLFVINTRADGLERARRVFLETGVPVKEVALSPLAEDVGKEMARHVLRQVPDSEQRESLVDEITRLAQGNPLAVEEAVQALFDGGRLRPVTGGDWEMSPAPGDNPGNLPGTTLELFRIRVEALPGSLRKVLELVAVAGDRFWATMLQGLLGDEVDEGMVVELLHRGFLVHHHGAGARGVRAYAFAQTAVREAVYLMIPQSRREVLHREIARWMEGPEAQDLGWLNGLVGYHYYKGRDAERAFPHLLALGRRAMAARVEEDAADLLALSLEALAGVSAERIPVDRKRQIELGIRADLIRLLVASGALERAIECAECEMTTEVPQDGGQQVNRARVLLWLGRAYRDSGRTEEAQQAFRRALEGLVEHPKTAQVRCAASAGLATCMVILGDEETGADLLRKTVVGMNALVHDVPSLEEHLADAYNDLGDIELSRGRTSEALAAFDTAFAHAVACHAPMSEVNALAGRGRAEREAGQDSASQRSFQNAYAAAQKWSLLERGQAVASELHGVS